MQYKNIHRIEKFKNIQEPRVENYIFSRTIQDQIKSKNIQEHSRTKSGKIHFFKNNSRPNKIQKHSRTFKDQWSSNENIFCLEQFYTIRYDTFFHIYFFMLYNISKVSFLCRNPFKY